MSLKKRFSWKKNPELQAEILCIIQHRFREKFKAKTVEHSVWEEILSIITRDNIKEEELPSTAQIQRWFRGLKKSYCDYQEAKSNEKPQNWVLLRDILSQKTPTKQISASNAEFLVEKASLNPTPLLPGNAKPEIAKTPLNMHWLSQAAETPTLPRELLVPRSQDRCPLCGDLVSSSPSKGNKHYEVCISRRIFNPEDEEFKELSLLAKDIKSCIFCMTNLEKKTPSLSLIHLKNCAGIIPKGFTLLANELRRILEKHDEEPKFIKPVQK